MAFFDFIKPLMIKAPEITYFDHLVGEFESFATAFAASPSAPPAPKPDEAAAADAGRPAVAMRGAFEEARKTVAQLKVKRNNETIDWNDLYLFEMLLADVRPVGSLRSKVLSLRRDYRSVAGQVEYDEYLASKPKNLLDPPDPRNPPDADANYELLMRDDLKDLLGRLFKRYAILPIREGRLKRLTIYASLFCALFLILLLAFIVSMSWAAAEQQQAAVNSNTPRGAANGTNANSNDNRAAGQAQTSLRDGGQRPLVPSIALFVVLVSGAMGGFVSALQRIQSSPTEGDSVYNLAMLYHGSYAVFVAPLTGAVFAILLYMMFTGKILEGRFFPDIYTPSASTATPTPTPIPTPTPTPRTSPTPTPTPAGQSAGQRRAPAANANLPGGANTNSNANANSTDANNAGNANDTAAGGGAAGNSNANAGGGAASDTDEAETPEATPTPRQVPTRSIRVKDFLYDSGPAGGQDYALLIIWSFIAGFAERFVPDSLNRLIASKQSGGKPGA